MEITYYGHSCFNIKLGKCNLLFDPFISGNPIAKGVSLEQIKADFILISHAHGDHLGDALEIAARNSSVVIAGYEVKEWLSDKGLAGGIGLNLGGKLNTDFGTVRFVNAIHSSSFDDKSYGGNPGGFVVESNEGNFYFAGDTALTMDLKLIPMYAPLSFALLPIGGHYTMDYHDAVLAANFIECEKIIGMHYDTFSAIKINHEAAKEFFEANGKKLILMNPLETMTI